MKSIEHSAAVKPLPAKYFAVLFEGPWLFTQNPADRNRILAICPYLDPVDHAFEFGFWKNENLSGLTNDQPETIASGTLYTVDLQSEHSTAPDFHELFAPAATTYSLIYLCNTRKGNPLNIVDVTSLRRVSIARPMEIRGAGKLLNSPVIKGVSSNEKSFNAGTGGQPSNHATTILIYPYLDAPPSLTIQSAPVPVLAGAKPHLVFRARGTTNTFIDNYTDNLHLVESFDMVRRLVTVQDPDFADNAPSPVDLGLYPSSGSQRFERGDTAVTEFSNAELGLPADSEQGLADVKSTGLRLASCASGNVIVNRDDLGH